MKSLLQLDWDYPVFVKEQSGKYARTGREALPRDEALKLVAGDDPRPLLVLRECGWCEGTDDALLDTKIENEKTVLLTHWFHMVKLPNDVLADDHPFRNLFGDKDPPHLLVMSRDGTQSVPLSGQQSQSELWKALETVLDAAYQVDATKVVKRIYKLLDRFDELDRAEALLAKELDEQVEQGASSRKLDKLKKEQAKLAEERKEVRDELDGLRRLGGTPSKG